MNKSGFKSKVSIDDDFVIEFTLKLELLEFLSEIDINLRDGR